MTSRLSRTSSVNQTIQRLDQSIIDRRTARPDRGVSSPVAHKEERSVKSTRSSKSTRSLKSTSSSKSLSKSKSAVTADRSDGRRQTKYRKKSSTDPDASNTKDVRRPLDPPMEIRVVEAKDVASWKDVSSTRGERDSKRSSLVKMISRMSFRRRKSVGGVISVDPTVATGQSSKVSPNSTLAEGPRATDTLFADVESVANKGVLPNIRRIDPLKAVSGTRRVTYSGDNITFDHSSDNLRRSINFTPTTAADTTPDQFSDNLRRSFTTDSGDGRQRSNSKVNFKPTTIAQYTDDSTVSQGINSITTCGVDSLGTSSSFERRKVKKMKKEKKKKKQRSKSKERRSDDQGCIVMGFPITELQTGIQGTYYGPVNDSFQPHGEGEFRIQNTANGSRFQFKKTVWESGFMVSNQLTKYKESVDLNSIDRGRSTENTEQANTPTGNRQAVSSSNPKSLNIAYEGQAYAQTDSSNTVSVSGSKRNTIANGDKAHTMIASPDKQKASRSKSKDSTRSKGSRRSKSRDNKKKKKSEKKQADVYNNVKQTYTDISYDDDGPVSKSNSTKKMEENNESRNTTAEANTSTGNAVSTKECIASASTDTVGQVKNTKVVMTNAQSNPGLKEELYAAVDMTKVQSKTPRTFLSKHSLEEELAKSAASLAEYSLGDVARARNDMVIPDKSKSAVQVTSTIKIHDKAFLQRSNGLWTVAVLADRGMQPKNSYRSSSHWFSLEEMKEYKSDELEESLLFVINLEGGTKIVPVSSVLSELFSFCYHY